jgi:hypothetical protein
MLSAFEPSTLWRPARDRVFRGCREAQQEVPHRIDEGHLAGAVDLKSRVAVMQERHVGQPQRVGERGHAFVPRARNRVEALPTRSQFARAAVELAAEHLRTGKLEQRRWRQPGAAEVDVAVAQRKLATLQCGDELVVNRFSAIQGRPAPQ